MNPSREDRALDAAPIVPLVSKSIPPLLPPGHMPRQRITDLLKTGMRQKITFVSATEGYGKTTALVDWGADLAEHGAVVVWFTFDRGDMLPQRFWANLKLAFDRKLGALAQAKPDGHAPMSADPYGKLLSDNASDRLEAIWNLANAVSALADPDRPIVLVMEHVDFVIESQTLEEFVRFANALSPYVHLYLSSRMRFTKYDLPAEGIPEIPFCVSSADLAYTENELANVAERVLGKSPDPETVSALLLKTKGWPLGVKSLLASATFSNGESRRTISFAEEERSLWNFFEHEVFERQSEDIRLFMLNTSMLGALCADLCDYMLDTRGSKDKIAYLHKQNLFIDAFNGKTDWFAYHPLFASWLERRAKTLPPETVRQSNSRASRWLLRHGKPEAAARHQILAAEHSGLINLVHAAFPQKSVHELDRYSDKHILEQPYDKLPPEFCLMAAWAYTLTADLDNAEFWIAKLKPTSLDSESLDVSLRLMRMKHAYLRADFETGSRLAEGIGELIKGESMLPLHIVLTNCHAEAFDLQGDLEKGLEFHRKAEAASESYDFAYMASINLYETAYAFFMLGDLQTVERICRSLENRFPHDFPTHAAARTLFAFASLIKGDAPDIENVLESARPLLSPHRNLDMYLDWCIANAWRAVSENRHDKADLILLEAIEFLQSRRAVVPRGVAPLPFANRAVINLLLGRTEIAHSIHTEFSHTKYRDTAYSTLIWKFVDWAYLRDQGKDDETQSLEAVIDQAKSLGFQQIAQHLHLELACFCFIKKKRPKAFMHLKEALGYALRSQSTLPFVIRRQRMRPLLIAYIEAANPGFEQRSFIRKLMRRSDFRTDNEPLTQATPVLDEESAGEPADIVPADDASVADTITPREKEVLDLAATGLSRAEIAEELCITENTVKTHLSHLYTKFSVRRFGDLMAKAADHGLV